MTRLHLPGPLPSRPLCNRQLSGHRPERAQNTSTMQIAGSLDQFHQAKARCRWCLRAIGALPAVNYESQLTDAVLALARADDAEEF